MLLSKISIIAVFIALLLPFRVLAQVTLDSTFGNNGIVITPTNNSSSINTITLQSDGKIVAAGYWFYQGTYHIQLARYSEDGILDSNFGIGGIVNTNINNSSRPFAIVIQADDKILVGGNYQANTSPPFQFHSFIVRYNQDGTLDSTFGNGGIVNTVADPTNDGISSMSLQTDGKIIAGGWAYNQFLLMRYNPNGTLDNSFGTGGMIKISIEGTESSIYAIKLQPNGKILAAGVTGDIINFKFALVRFNNDGTVDSTFGISGKVITDFNPFYYDVATSIVLLANGQILLAGYSESDIAMAKYNNDGSPDVIFGNGGKISLANYPPVPPNGVAIQSDGKIITTYSVQDSSSYSFCLTRFYSNGLPDSSFGNNGKLIVNIKPGDDYAQCLIIQPDDKIIVAGSSRDGQSSPAEFTLIRLTSDVVTGTTEIIPHIDYINLHPNPVRDNIKIKIDNKIKIENIVLYDIKGKIIAEYSPEERNLNLSQISQGLYLLSITTERGIFNQPVVKL